MGLAKEGTPCISIYWRAEMWKRRFKERKVKQLYHILILEDSEVFSVRWKENFRKFVTLVLAFPF